VYSDGKRMRTSDDILDTLYTLDFLCAQRKIVAELIILGGSGILLNLEMMDEQFRSTRDIDVNLIATNDTKSLLATLSEVNIDIIGGVMEVPPMEDFKDRKNSFHELDADFKSLRIYVPEIELLACSKIFSTREKDLIDLKETSLLKKCDRDKLLSLVEEYKGYILNINNPDLNYHQLHDILKELGI